MKILVLTALLALRISNMLSGVVIRLWKLVGPPPGVR